MKNRFVTGVAALSALGISSVWSDPGESAPVGTAEVHYAFDSAAEISEPGKFYFWQSEPSGAGEIDGEEKSSGVGSLRLAGGETRLQLVRVTPPTGKEFGEGIWFYRFDLKPTADEEGEAQTILNVGGAEIGLVKRGTSGHLVGYSGEEVREWDELVELQETGEAKSWLEFTIRVDEEKRLWDLWVDAVPVFTGLKLGGDKGIRGDDFALYGAASGLVYLDDFKMGRENPLFVDKDRDGIADTYEKVTGSDPGRDDGIEDWNSNGKGNLQEFVDQMKSINNGEVNWAARGRIIYVDSKRGDDAASGLQPYRSGVNAPKKTVPAALGASRGGDTIVLEAGEYPVPSQFPSPRSGGIYFRAMGPVFFGSKFSLERIEENTEEENTNEEDN